MTLEEIKSAVESGKTVHWSNGLYVVIKDGIGQWLVKCTSNNCCCGLTWRDGVTMNGKPEQFYVAGDSPNVAAERPGATTPKP
jgi:hypothetical protein